MALFPLKLVPAGTKIPFINARLAAFAASAAALIASVVLFFAMGLNLGIDFRGGTVIEIETASEANIPEIRDIVNAAGLGDVRVQEFGSPTAVVIRIEQQEARDGLSPEAVQQLASADVQKRLAAAYAGTEYSPIAEAREDVAFTVTGAKANPAAVEEAVQAILERRPTYFRNPELDVAATETGTGAHVRLDFDLDSDNTTAEEATDIVQFAVDTALSGITFNRSGSIGPVVSGELAQAGTLALVSAVILMLMYIWFRFEWQFSLGAVLALVHDVVLTIGVFSLLQLEFTLAIIAAILTIIGYSMNDTVVVYDRVRENLRKYKRKPLTDVLNLSINDTLARTVMTSVTTLLALISLYVFGGEILRGFTFAMIWGVIVGTYSSIFIAAPLLLITDVKRDWSKEGSGEGAAAAP